MHQAIKFGKLKEHKREIFFFKNHAKNEAERLVPDLFYHILCMIFKENYFSCYIFLTDQIFLSEFLDFLKYWPICVLQIVYFPGCNVINFEIILFFLIKLFFYMIKKLNILKPKRPFKVN